MGQNNKKTTEELVQERPSDNELKSLKRIPINVVLDNVRSLDNVGLIFRICELARIEKLYLTGYTGYPKLKNDKRPKQVIKRHDHRITKTAVYAVPHQPWEYVEDPLPLVKKLKKEGSQIVALEQTKNSVTYYKEEYKSPLTLIVGHERLGVRQELIDAADTIVDIPILGIGNSHNVAVSTSIMIYHILEKTGNM